MSPKIMILFWPSNLPLCDSADFWCLITENSEHNTDLMDENNLSNDSQEACSDQEQTLPILKKIDDLSCKVQVEFHFHYLCYFISCYFVLSFICSFNFIWLQNLRKEHTILCNEVKSITEETFPGTEVFGALQGLSMFTFFQILAYSVSSSFWCQQVPYH